MPRSIGLAVLLVGSIAAFALHSRVSENNRVIRVGVDHTPPFYYAEPGRPVRGLAVDVLNEAARRLGYTLVWVPETKVPLNDALSKGEVDMWPIVAATAERKAKFYTGRPWLESDYVVISNDRHPVIRAQDAANLPVAHASLGVTRLAAWKFFPHGTFLEVATREEAVIRVCQQTAAAAVLETRVLDTMLLKRPPGCESVSFHIVTIPGASRPLGIMAVHSIESQARRIDQEIQALTKDGFLSEALDAWCPFTAESMRSVWDREEAQQTSRITAVGAIVISVLAVILGIVLRRAVRLRHYAERAKQDQEIAAEQLRVSERRWQLALQGAGDGLWDWDIEADRVFRSQSCLDMLGYSPAEVPQTPDAWRKLIHPDDLPVVLHTIHQHLTGMAVTFSCEFRIRHCSGEWRWILDRGQAVFDASRRPVRLAGSQTDITARKIAEARLNTEANTDELTGVANRREFNRTLDLLFREARESNRPLTLSICDLDHFKSVNDTHGHRAGDQVLSRFAAVAHDTLRKSDFVARTGGDEFVLLLPDTTEQEAVLLIERLRRRVEAISFEVSTGAPFRTSCSFGIASLSSRHKSGSELLESADQSLYAAKKRGRNTVLAA